MVISLYWEVILNWGNILLLFVVVVGVIVAVVVVGLIIPRNLLRLLMLFSFLWKDLAYEKISLRIHDLRIRLHCDLHLMFVIFSTALHSCTVGYLLILCPQHLLTKRDTLFSTSLLLFIFLYPISLCSYDLNTLTFFFCVLCGQCLLCVSVVLYRDGC